MNNYAEITSRSKDPFPSLLEELAVLFPTITEPMAEDHFATDRESSPAVETPPLVWEPAENIQLHTYGEEIVRFSDQPVEYNPGFFRYLANHGHATVVALPPAECRTVADHLGLDRRPSQPVSIDHIQTLLDQSRSRRLLSPCEDRIGCLEHLRDQFTPPPLSVLSPSQLTALVNHPDFPVDSVHRLLSLFNLC